MNVQIQSVKFDADKRLVEDLVACHQSKAFEESVDEAIDALKRQLDKFKAKFEK